MEERMKEIRIKKKVWERKMKDKFWNEWERWKNIEKIRIEKWVEGNRELVRVGDGEIKEG